MWSSRCPERLLLRCCGCCSGVVVVAPSAHRSSTCVCRRLSEPRLSEAERQACEAQWADRSLFVTELLLSTLLPDEDASASSSEDEDNCPGSLRSFADFEAMGCVEVMTLDVALENLNLKETSPAPKTPKTTTKPAPTKKEPPAPPL